MSYTFVDEPIKYVPKAPAIVKSVKVSDVAWNLPAESIVAVIPYFANSSITSWIESVEAKVNVWLVILPASDLVVSVIL